MIICKRGLSVNRKPIQKNMSDITFHYETDTAIISIDSGFARYLKNEKQDLEHNSNEWSFEPYSESLPVIILHDIKRVKEVYNDYTRNLGAQPQ